MSTRVLVSIALAGSAAWAAGCSASSSRPAPGAAVGARATALARVRCGAPPISAVLRRDPGTETLALPGAPDGIATTPDGATAFVALQSGTPRVGVLATGSGSPRLLGTVAVPATPSGMRLTPDGRHVLAAAGRGAVILDVVAARAGSKYAVVGTLTAPRSVAGRGPGAAEIAVSRDSRYAFVTLEGAGRVAVFRLTAALAHRRGAYVGEVPVGAGALGIAIAPDGRRLYEVSESAQLAGHSRGALNVIDVARALRDPRHAVLASVPVPCAPVRVAVSPRGDTVWVTARNGDALLGYAAARLAATPTRALTSVTRVGADPLGLAVVAGARVLVADADLGDHAGARSGVSVVSTGSGAPRLVGLLPSGAQADAIAPAAGGRALVTDSSARQVQVIALAGLPH